MCRYIEGNPWRYKDAILGVLFMERHTSSMEGCTLIYFFRGWDGSSFFGRS